MGGDEEGGLENHVVELGNALASSHNVHIIAHAKYEDRFKSVSFHAVDLTKSRRNPLMLLLIRQTILMISPDIIHAHANKAASVISFLKYFLPTKIKYVATLHSLKKRLSSYEKFDWVIGVSQRVLFEIKNPNKSVIYNGVFIDKKKIKTQKYLQDEFGLDPSKKVFVSIGRLVKVKRFDVLINAFQGINNAYLLIVGDGELKEALEQKIKVTSQNNIQLLGHRKDNIEILSAADVCIISSEREGFSYVMAESLLVGTPVISTDVADMKKILPDQSIVPVNKEQELHNLMSTFFDNPKEMIAGYSPVFEWASKNLTFDKMVDSTSNVYKKVTT
jgi:glycosyltransferase involved in cell wall biosynthesis